MIVLGPLNCSRTAVRSGVWLPLRPRSGARQFTSASVSDVLIVQRTRGFAGGQLHKLLPVIRGTVREPAEYRPFSVWVVLLIAHHSSLIIRGEASPVAPVFRGMAAVRLSAVSHRWREERTELVSVSHRWRLWAVETYRPWAGTTLYGIFVLKPLPLHS